MLVKELLAHIAEQKTGTLIALALEVIRAMRAWLREHGFAQLASRGMSDIFTSSSKADWPRMANLFRVTVFPCSAASLAQSHCLFRNGLTIR